MDSGRKIAVFLDFDNIKLGLENQNIDFNIEPVIEYLNTKGKIILSKAYGDWDKMSNVSYDELKDKKNARKDSLRNLYKIKDPKEKQRIKDKIKDKFKNQLEHIRVKKSSHIRRIKKQLIEYSFDIVDMPSRKSGKNFSDIQLAVDCLETGIFNKSIDTIAIISGDSDMTPLIKKIRYYGLEVIVIGAEESTSRMLSSVTDIFRFYSFLNLKKVDPNFMKTSPYLILCKAITLSKLTSGSDILDISFVNEKFKILSPKTYGRYYPIEGLLDDLVKQEIINIDYLKGDKIRVYEDSSQELPAMEHLEINIKYSSIKELKEYNRSYTHLLEDFNHDQEKIKEYIINLIIDLINYALLTENYQKIIIDYPFNLKESDTYYNEVLNQVDEIINHMVKSKKITFDEHEKIYIPYFPDYNQNNTIYLLNREIDKLKKRINSTEMEKDILKNKITEIEDDKALYKKLVQSINKVQMKEYELNGAIENLINLSKNPKYRKASNLYLGKAYMKKGDFDKVINVYEDMLKHGIKNTYIYNILGTAYVKTGDYSNALENFQKSLLINSEQARIIHYVNELTRYFSDNNMVRSN